MKRNYLVLGGCVMAALLLTFIQMMFDSPVLSKATAKQLNDETIPLIEQNVISAASKPYEVKMLYENEQVIGVLKQEEKLDALLKSVYEEQYRDDFPDSQLALGKDVHVESTLTSLVYEDKDDEILNYLKKNDLFSVEVNQVIFSNGEHVYVKDLELFEQAKENYVSSFLDEESYQTLKDGKETPSLQTYGERFTGYEIIENANYTKGFAPVSDIILTKEEAAIYFAYGMEYEEEYYTTQEYDTVQGVAWLNSMDVSSLLAINSSVLKSENQLLAIGTQLNVAKPDSPIQVKTTKEVLTEEVIYAPETQYIYDDTLREGISEVVTVGENGSKDVTYEVTYINGVWQSSAKRSEKITKNPVQEVVRVGTKVEPKIGSGVFGWPVYNPMVSCGWYCYGGHQALDVQNAYNRYDKVLASDRGVVIENSYRSINGYYMIIDHNNGYQTYYGHMSGPGFFPVGATVAKGEVIGNIGMTGLATGPHVHFEIRLNGQQVNPALYLN